MILRLAENSDKDQWDDFVREQGGSIFHSWNWRILLERTFAYKAQYVVAEIEGKICGLLPAFNFGGGKRRRIVSVPQADFGGPLAKDKDLKKKLIKFLYEKNHGHAFNVLSRDAHENPGEDLKTAQPFCHFELEIKGDSEEILKKIIPQKTRNMIYKAERSGLITGLVAWEKDSDSYYRLYFATMKKLLSLPLPRLFFKEMKKIFGDSLLLFSTYKEKCLAAGIVALVWNKVLYIWSNASDQRFLSLGANNAVYFEAIKYAANNGLSMVELGNSMAGTSHHFFKSRWGAVEKPVYLISKGRHFGGNSAQKRIIKFLTNLPMSLLDKISYFAHKYY